ncbi:MAG: NAD(P)/FAD-dependent oxidoreductase [Candidatus Nanopelagicales bacterium]
MDIVIVGGGMAGLTAAAMLNQTKSHDVTVLEKAAGYGDVGYGIGLYPLGGTVFNAFGAHDQLRAHGAELTTYSMYGPDGTLLQEVNLAELLSDFGPMLSLSRSDIIEVLADQVRDLIIFGQDVTTVEKDGDRVRVSTASGSSYEGDVIIAADGMHSAVRQQLFGEAKTYSTGFDAWMWWCPESACDQGRVAEYWGAVGFVGLYPMPGKVNVAVAVPHALSPDPSLPADEILAQLRTVIEEHSPGAAKISGLWEIVEGKPFLWPLDDVQAPEIVALDNRVALAGDSGIGFLPTAGVGASNAIRSAASLAYELSISDATTVPAALDRWRSRVQDLVLANQKASRETGKVMLMKHKSSAAAVKVLMKHMPITSITKSISKSMQAPF